jgi:hypothetical protein
MTSPAEPNTSGAGTSGSTPGSTGSSSPSTFQDILQGAYDLLGLPFQVAQGTSDVAAAVASAGAPLLAIARGIDWLFYPNHWIRIFAGIAGLGFTGAGLFMMAHVDASVPVSAYGVSSSVHAPKATLPLGILFTGLGAGGLFVAFHNVPDDVQTLPQFLAFLTDRVRAGQVPSGSSNTAAASSGG